ncbi:MAG TPA: hypothetical protein ENK44_02510 [Caldithrix abyssi]|uniref:Ribbon-helix-helix protein, CopG family n=1 Tax=Caldithrix abyssi TaxID=187145 RepID=A0A7V4TZL2_CALAY|nr:hypothetical protein [Caldithrix abyssi]
MDKKSKLINIRISPQEYEKIKAAASQLDMSVSQYIRYMATVLTDLPVDFSEMNESLSKHRLENDLQRITQNLERRRQQIDMLLRSVNSAALKLESQFKKFRMETAQELHKDFERIHLLVEE